MKKSTISIFMLLLLLFQSTYTNASVQLTSQQGQKKLITFKEKKEIDKFLKTKFKEGKYLNLETKKTLLRKDYLHLTINNSKILYKGGLKDNKPDGLGIVLSKNSNIVSINYIGYFKDGMANGYGILFSDVYNDDTPDTTLFKLNQLGVRYMEYEGMFKDNKYSGLGNQYSIKLDSNGDVDTNSVKQYLNKNISAINKFSDQVSGSEDGVFICDIPLYDSVVLYIGKFSGNEYEGEGKLYKNDALTYEGGFHNGEYDGNGVLYFLNSSKIKYKGGFKNGLYSGKGVLYNEKGETTYSGEWKKGNVK